MKWYIVTTGVVFALLTLAHVARMLEEGTYLIREPIFLATTVASVGLSVWAIVLLRRLARS